MVTSGRCVPPAYGSFRITTSPSAQASTAARAASTLAGMAPRWTGMWAACATRAPPLSNTAQEKSSRSLMLGEWLVRRSVTPISSATPSKRWR